MVFSDKGRPFRYLLIGVVVVLAAIIVALLVTSLIVPSDFIVAQIASKVRQRTGRDLRISGPISFSVMPRFALVAHDVTLANPSGFSGDFLSVKTVDVGLKPLALLHGSIEIDQLKLLQPRADFEIDKDGRRNWIFHPPQPPPSTVPPEKASAGPSFITGNVTIVGGAASFFDRREGPKRSVKDLNMTLSLPSLDGPFKAMGSAVHNDDGINLAVTVAAPPSSATAVLAPRWSALPRHTGTWVFWAKSTAAMSITHPGRSASRYHRWAICSPGRKSVR